MAFAANRRNFQPRGNQYIPPQLRTGNNYGSTESKFRTNFFCDHCKITGHTMARCYKLHGYPQNFKGDRRIAAVTQLDDSAQLSEGNVENVTFTPSQYQQILQLLGKEGKEDSTTTGHNVKSGNVAGKFCFISSYGSKWIVDSGATDHMCHDLSMFSTNNDLQSTDNFITIPNGNKVKVTHSGTVAVSDKIILKDVLYVPEFKFNLISIPKVCTDMQCHVVFTDNGCYIRSSSMPPQHLGSL